MASHFPEKIVFFRKPNLRRVFTLTCACSGLIFATYVYLDSEQANTLSILTISLIFGCITCLYMIVNEFNKLNQNNRIELTNNGLVDYQQRFLGRIRCVEIPFTEITTRVKERRVSEPGIFMPLLRFIFAPGVTLIINQHKYKSVTIRNYNELRSTLVALIGLEKEIEVWEYE